jgi:hypothetical protein
MSGNFNINYKQHINELWYTDKHQLIKKQSVNIKKLHYICFNQLERYIMLYATTSKNYFQHTILILSSTCNAVFEVFVVVQ